MTIVCPIVRCHILLGHFARCRMSDQPIRRNRVYLRLMSTVRNKYGVRPGIIDASNCCTGRRGHSFVSVTSLHEMKASTKLDCSFRSKQTLFAPIALIAIASRPHIAQQFVYVDDSRVLLASRSRNLRDLSLNRLPIRRRNDKWLLTSAH
jgi:hypothetical protein